MIDPMPHIIVGGDTQGEYPNAAVLSLARLVCEHGTSLWVSFGPSRVELRTPEIEMSGKCICKPSLAVIYKPKP